MKNPFSKIERTKRKLRACHAKYYAALDKMSCGRALGEALSPNMREAKTKWNKLIKELQTIDSAFPKGEHEI